MQESPTNLNSISIEWFKKPNELSRKELLEFARGVIYSLSAKGDGTTKEVHVTRIRNAFSKIGNPGVYRIALRLLVVLREVESLPNGYWLIAPFRVLRVRKHFIFVGSVPSVFGFLGDVEQHGLCRFVSEELAAKFPEQSIDSWMGRDKSTPKAVVDFFLENHRRKAVLTVNSADVEYLQFSVNTSKNVIYNWVAKPCLTILNEKVAICRQKIGNYYRYFSADLNLGGAVTETPLEVSIQRLIFALSSYWGTPIKTIVQTSLKHTKVTVSERLPSEEYRLALLYSDQILRSGRTTTYIVATHLSSSFLEKLTSLGCTLEITT